MTKCIKGTSKNSFSEPTFVIPAKAGIHNSLKLVDPRFRGDDIHQVFRGALKFIILFSLLFVPSMPSSPNPPSPSKIDLLLRVVISEPTSVTAKAISSDELTDAEVLIKAKAPKTAVRLIKELGGLTRSIAGDIIVARIPLSSIPELASRDDIIYIEAARRVRPAMLYARTTTGVADVQAGTGLDSAYTGSGVIVGTVDSGIDCLHADFKDADGDSRILYYWDQGESGSGVEEIENSYGTEYGAAEIADRSCANSPDDLLSGGHGTHVAGIAAGSDSVYKGVAPDANLIIVKYEISDTDSGSTGAYTLSTSVIDGVNYIFQKAQAIGRPAVVNLSIGTSLGAHDGTSLLEQGLDNLLMEGASQEKLGRVIVNAVGNENFSTVDTGADKYGGIHADIDVTEGAPKAFEFMVRDRWSSTVVEYGGAQVDIWLTSVSNCTIQLDGYDADDKSASGLKINMSDVSAGFSKEASDNEVTITLDFSDSQNANNGKQHALATATIVTNGNSDNLEDYSFDLIFTGTCTGDAWLYPDYTSYIDFTKDRDRQVSYAGYTYVAGDSNKTVTIPGTAQQIIAVGSFMDRATWVDENGTTHYQTDISESKYGATGGTAGDISLFSSLGPTADGRVKPELAAPGEPIISTLASNIFPSSAIKGDDTHFKLQGSSMAAPHVSGMAALMLEKNGCLTHTEIKNYLVANTAKDDFTGASLPDNEWGYGKLDALATLSDVPSSDCTPDNPSEGEQATGGAGCSLSQKKRFQFFDLVVVLGAIVFVVERLRRSNRLSLCVYRDVKR